MDIRDHIRSIPDFPKPGVMFYDISTLLADPAAWRETVEQLASHLRPLRPQLLAGIESRGFLVAAPLALYLGCGFIMVRKAGKLPGKVVRHAYDLEYGNDVIEIQADAVHPGQRVVVIDDLVATGGTTAATIDIIRRQGADVVGAASIIELTFLHGRKKIDVPFTALVAYDE